MLKPIYWIAICLLHPTFAALTTFGNAPNATLTVEDPNAYRLPTSVRPEHYKLEIVTHLENDDGFTGRVWMKV